MSKLVRYIIRAACLRAQAEELRQHVDDTTKDEYSRRRWENAMNNCLDSAAKIERDILKVKA